MKRGLLVRWLGVVLGLVLPGLGHACYRRFGKGLLFAVLGWGAVSLTLVLVATVGSPWGLALAAPWIPFVLLYMSWDAFRTVRPASPDERNEKAWWLVCMAAVGLLLATAALYEASIYYSPLRMGRVEGRSMSRTLEAGERVVLDMFAYDGGMPAPGDIVAFEYPEDRKRVFLQRCIAIGGQTVIIEDGVVHVDGVRFDEPEGVLRMREDFGPAVVRDGHFFVLGDNRLAASDSRRWGTVPLDHLQGRVVNVLRW